MNPRERADIVDRLTISAAMIEMGEKITWGSDTALMREAATEIASLRRELEVARTALMLIRDRGSVPGLKSDDWFNDTARAALNDIERTG